MVGEIEFLKADLTAKYKVTESLLLSQSVLRMSFFALISLFLAKFLQKVYLAIIVVNL